MRQAPSEIVRELEAIAVAVAASCSIVADVCATAADCSFVALAASFDAMRSS